MGKLLIFFLFISFILYGKNELEIKFNEALNFISGINMKIDEKKGIEIIEDLVKLDYPPAIARLCRYYKTGIIVAKDDNKGDVLCKKAVSKNIEKLAEFGNNDAIYELANLYYFGFAVEKDYYKSYELFNSLVTNNYDIAIPAIAFLFLEGNGVDRDEKKAFELFEKSIQTGNTKSQTISGLLYLNGIGTEKNTEKGIEHLLKSAEYGDSMAEYYLGMFYYYGEYVDKDMTKAFNYLESSSFKNYTEALILLGNMYLNGEGVSKNEKKAFDLYVKASINENFIAQEKLATMYLKGQGISKNDKKAFELYEKSAQQGYKWAQSELAGMYLSGQGITKNEKKAFEWYLKAAEQNETIAQNQIAFMYSNGQGIAKNEKKAFEWYSKAAEQNDDNAQYNLGLMYLKGIGTNKDIQQGYILMKKSAQLGNKDAQNIVNELKPAFNKISSYKVEIQKLFGTSKNDSPKSISLDSQGNIYVLWNSEGNYEKYINMGGNDVFLTKLNKYLEIEWIKQFGSINDDTAESIEIDTKNNIYILGTTDGDFNGNKNIGERDIFLIKLNKDGNKQWTKQFGSVNNDVANQIIIKNNNIIIFYNSIIEKYNTNGEKISSKEIHNDKSFIIDDKENIYALNGDYIKKYDKTNELQWKKNISSGLGNCYNSIGNKLILDTENNLFVIGSMYCSSANDEIIFKIYSESGKLLWDEAFWGTQSSDKGISITTDKNNDIFILGDTTGSLDSNTLNGRKDLFLSKFIKNKNQWTKIWTKQFGIKGYNNATSIKIDAEDNIYILAYSNGKLEEASDNEKGDDIYLLKLIKEENN